jgi:peroxiredoxin
MIGQPAPPWQISQPLNGTNPGLRAFLGRPILLLFFNIGCSGCTGRALPFTLELAERYPELQIIGVHSSFEAGSRHPTSSVQAVIDYFKLPYLVFMDDGDATFRAYEAEGTSHWVLINADGTIRKSVFGSMAGSLQRLNYALQELFPEAVPEDAS